MTGTPLDLLSLVGIGSRLLGLERSEAPATGEEFAGVLESARKGELDTGRVVVSGPGLGVDLTSDQLQRLAHAADVAEAQGARTAAVLIDGMVIRVDLASRTATASAPADAAVMPDVDVVVSAGQATPADATSEVLLRRLAPAGPDQTQH